MEITKIVLCIVGWIFAAKISHLFYIFFIDPESFARSGNEQHDQEVDIAYLSSFAALLFFWPFFITILPIIFLLYLLADPVGVIKDIKEENKKKKIDKLEKLKADIEELQREVLK